MSRAALIEIIEPVLRKAIGVNVIDSWNVRTAPSSPMPFWSPSHRRSRREITRQLFAAHPFGGSGMKKHEFEFRIEVSPLDETLPCAHCGHHQLCLVHEHSSTTWQCRQWRTRCEIEPSLSGAAEEGL